MSPRATLRFSNRSRLAAVVVMLYPNLARAQPVRVVQADGPPVWGEAIHLVEEIRIGALDGPEEYSFGGVTGIAVAEDGTIYVADRQGPIIRAYDRAGAFLRNVGRSGAGPGEYRWLGGIKVLEDGQLAVWDPGNGRISLYTRDGQPVASHLVATGLFSYYTFDTDDHGRYYVRAVLHIPTAGQDRQNAWIQIAPTGEVLDTVPIPLGAAPGRSFSLATPSGYDRPFVVEAVSTLGRHGSLITGRTDSYAIDYPDATGSVVRIQRASPRVRLNRRERAEWQEWATYFRRNAPPGSGVRPDVTIPSEKPIFKELFRDGDGRVWVRRYVQAEQRNVPPRPSGDNRPVLRWREPPTYDIFGDDGTFFGAVTLPWTAYLHAARGRHVWVTVRGELDETYVVRYRLAMPR